MWFMQANEFEKNIQATMETFSIKPNDAVWNNVAKRIAKKKERRRAIFWFFSTAILCGAIGLWILNREHKKMGSKNENTTISNTIKNIDPENEKLKKDMVKDNTITTKPINSNLVEKHDNNVPEMGIKRQPVTSNNYKEQLVINKKLAEAKFLLNKNIQTKQKIVQSSFDSKVASDHKIEKTSFEKSLSVENISNKQIEITSKNLEKTKSDSNSIIKEPLVKNVTDTFLVANKSLIKQPLQKPKWKVGINILAGISDNLQFGNGKNMDVNSSLSIPPVSTFGNNTSTPLSFTTSYSFGVGGFISKPLNKKFDFSVGVNYHFYQTSSRVGNKINRSASNFNAAFLQDISINDYYTYENIAGYKNNYHLLQTPILVSYKMNKNASHSFRLLGGIAPGYLVGTKALFDNKGSRILYEDKKQFHHFNISVNAGAMWGWKNKNRNEIELGPVLQYQINNLVKPVVSTPQHLFFTGIKTNFFFK